MSEEKIETIEKERFPFKALEDKLLKGFTQDRVFWSSYFPHIDSLYFNNKDIGKMFTIFKTYFDKYKDLPSKEQVMYLGTQKGYVPNTLKKFEEVFNLEILKKDEIEFIEDETYQFIRNSKIQRAILESVDLVEGERFDEIEEIIRSAVNWHNRVELGTNYANAVDRYAKLHELMTNITASPWPSLNNVLGGGFFRKELVVFAAASSVGKSIALDQIALHAWDKLGLNVVLITLELSEERKGQRMDACKFGIPVSEVVNKKNELIKSFENDKHQNKLWIKEFPTSSVSTQAIEQYLYQLEVYEGLHKPDILIVDYLDILEPKKKARIKDEYGAQGAVGGDLRAIGQELDIPVITASQLNRGAVDTNIFELNEATLADSWKKFMIADTMIIMAATVEERAKGILNLKTAKSRNGKKDEIIGMNIIYEQLKITDRLNEYSSDLQQKAKDMINKE